MRKPPAAVGDRGSTGNVLGDVIFGAFAKAVPERVMAGCGPLHGLTFSGIDPRRGDYFVNYETYAGASGAQHDQDGKDAVRVHVSGAANLPVEAAEHEFPLTILRYEFIPDSGGPGRFRGGLGTRREVCSWAGDGRLVGRGLRQVVGAPGLDGGGNGRTGRFPMDDGSRRETASQLLRSADRGGTRSASRRRPARASAILSARTRSCPCRRDLRKGFGWAAREALPSGSEQNGHSSLSITERPPRCAASMRKQG